MHGKTLVSGVEYVSVVTGLWAVLMALALRRGTAARVFLVLAITADVIFVTTETGWTRYPMAAAAILLMYRLAPSRRQTAGKEKENGHR